MALTTTSDRSPAYTGNGATTAFATTFEFPAITDIVVLVNDVQKALTTDYTVSGAGLDAGGTVTFVVAPANGAIVRIYRSVAFTQDTQFLISDKFPALTVEGRFDRLVMMIQQLAGRLGGVAFYAYSFMRRTATAWDAEGFKISNVANGTASSDVVTKAQLDSVTGSSGNVSTPLAPDVGKVWTATGVGATGWQAAAGSVPTPANPADNGKHISASAGAYILRTAAESRTDLGLGTAATVNTGTTNGTVPLIGAGNVLASIVLPKSTFTALGATRAATNAEVKAETDGVAGTGEATAVVPQIENVRHHPGIAKAWVAFNGITGAVIGQYNITSVVRTAVGVYTINVDTDFVGAETWVAMGSVVAGTPSETGYVTFDAGYSAGTFFIKTTNSGGTKVDYARVMLVFHGSQI